MRRLRANLVARGQRLRCYLKTSSTLCEEGLKACKDKYTTGGGVAPVGEEKGMLARGGGEAASDVVGYVGDEQLFDLASDWARRGGDLVAGDFAYADDVAIGGGDENFVGGIKIFWAEGLLDDVDARFRGDLEENAAGDAFETAGV